MKNSADPEGQSFEMWSLSECIPWMTVGLVEFVAIVTLNLCTIIVFMRNRNLRKRSTYLVINLAVIDMFVGGAVMFNMFYRPGVLCNLFKWHLIEYWTSIFKEVLMALFTIASLTNITIIALERVHATFCPLRHRVLKKWVYRLMVAIVWVISGLFAIALEGWESFKVAYHVNITAVFLIFSAIFPLIICISYTSIVIKVRCGAQPQHHGAASREKKLTMTLLIVTVVSLMLYLPHIIWLSVLYISNFEIWWSFSVVHSLDTGLMILLYANSLVNPILYAIRMPEYRSAFLALFRRRPQQQRQVEGLPLREMQRR